MKKIIFILIFILGMAVFAEKLSTDGKNNLDKLKGTWGGAMYHVVYKNNQWYFGSYDAEGTIWHKVETYKNGVFVVRNAYQISSMIDKNFYFAWDTKYKTFVELDKDLNIIDKVPRKVNHPYN